jgi:WD40 repeat protein
MQLSPASYCFVPLRSRCSEHPVLSQGHQSVLLPYCERPSFAPIQNWSQNYSFVCSNVYIFKCINVFVSSNPECRRIASGSKDGDIRIWDVVLGQTLLTLTGHSKAVTCVKWGGAGLVYTSSQDCTVKVWRADDVRLASCCMLSGSHVTTA